MSKPLGLCQHQLGFGDCDTCPSDRAFWPMAGQAVGCVPRFPCHECLADRVEAVEVQNSVQIILPVFSELVSDPIASSISNYERTYQ